MVGFFFLPALQIMFSHFIFSCQGKANRPLKISQLSQFSIYRGSAMPSSDQKASAEHSSSQITSFNSRLSSPDSWCDKIHVTGSPTVKKVLSHYTLIIQNWRLRADINQPWLNESRVRVARMMSLCWLLFLIGSVVESFLVKSLLYQRQGLQWLCTKEMYFARPSPAGTKRDLGSLAIIVWKQEWD